jgi:D-alanyl-D-alanine carboxypeptidase
VRRRGLVLAAVAATALAACSSRAKPPAERAVAASPTADASSTAAPTPSPTPEPSAEPARTRYDGTIARLPGWLATEMRGTTWKPGCPVPLEDLRLLRFNYHGFGGGIRRGPMVVHEDVAEDVLWVFRQLFEAGFAIKRVGLSKEFVPSEFEPVITSKRSVTASFNCRPVITPLGPSDDFSQHSFGMAIDINPVQNPYVTADGFVRNTEARRYLDRSKRLPGMIHAGDVVVRSFTRIGWEWGGTWSGGKDYMHFSTSGT